MNFVGLALTMARYQNLVTHNNLMTRFSGAMFSLVHYEPKYNKKSELHGELNHAMEVTPMEEKLQISEGNGNSVLETGSEPAKVKMSVKLL